MKTINFQRINHPNYNKFQMMPEILKAQVIKIFLKIIKQKGKYTKINDKMKNFTNLKK